MNLSSTVLPFLDQQLFEAVPGSSVLLLPNTPLFTVVAVTEAFVQASGRRKNELIGKGFFEAFPELTSVTETEDEKQLRESFELVLRKKQPHRLPLRLHNLALANGSFEQRFLSTINKPILGEAEDVRYILYTIEDVTDRIKRKEQQQHQKSAERAYKLFMNVPIIIGVVRGDDYIIDMANEGLLEVWGRSTDVVGKPLLHAIPELARQGYVELLDEVRRTGVPYHANQAPIKLVRNGKEELLYFNFVYKPFIMAFVCSISSSRSSNTNASFLFRSTSSTSGMPLEM